MIETLRYDGRYALRQLRKAPGFACTALCILGLGIATNVAIFAFVDATLFAPLPYRDQDRLVSVFETTDTETRGAVSYLNYLDWGRLNQVFASIEAYGGSGGELLVANDGWDISRDRSQSYWRLLWHSWCEAHPRP